VKTNIDDGGIVERALVRLDLVQCIGKGKTGRVDPLSCHRRDHVGDREDASPDKDLVSLQSSRISRAVYTFVMLQDHFGNRPREPELGHDVIACLAMALHDLDLSRTQVVATIEELFGDSHLSDVMESRRHLDSPDLIVREVEFPDDQGDHMSHLPPVDVLRVGPEPNAVRDFPASSNV